MEESKENKYTRGDMSTSMNIHYNPNIHMNILKERRVDNNAKLGNAFNNNIHVHRNNINMNVNQKTPQSIQSSTGAGMGTGTGTGTGTKLEFTPSPLSVFSKEQERGAQAIVILISSDIMYQEQHVQQQNALMILLSDKFHLPVKVIDGKQEKFRKKYVSVDCLIDNWLLLLFLIIYPVYTLI